MHDQENTFTLDIHLQFSSNPRTLKYVFSRPLPIKGIHYYRNIQEAETTSPIAKRLLSIPNVASVLLLSSEIHVTYQEYTQMPKSHEQVILAIKEHLEKGEELIFPLSQEVGKSVEEQQITDQIAQFITQEIQPLLQQDGGDIEFIDYLNGTLFVRLQGACHGCPHAMMTLQGGVLNRVQIDFPQVENIVAL